MPKVLVLFHSRSGHTARLAEAIAEGARSVRFTEVDLRRIAELGEAVSTDEAAPAPAHRLFDDAALLGEYDAIVVGSPVYGGLMTAEVKRVLDQALWLRPRGVLTDKVGSAFASAASPSGGQETAAWAMLTAMATLGMILVPPPVGEVNEDPVEIARRQGKRVATVAEWVRHAKSHEHGHHHHHH